jgi:chitodextrinase
VVICASLCLAVACGQEVTPGPRLPAAPAGVTAEAGSATSVHVMWTRATGEPEVARYEVYRGTEKVKEVPGDEHMADVVRLEPSTTYAFTVRARSTDGELGPPSVRVRATTPVAGAADSRPPGRPGDLEGKVVGDRAVQLSWGRSTDDRGVASYEILQGGTKVHSVGGGQSATVVTGLRPGTRYAFSVRARDTADNVSPVSETVRLTTAEGADDGRGTAPTRFRATARRADGAYHLDLSWVPPRADGAVTEYEVHLDGRLATSLVWGGTAPRDEAEYSFYVGREPGVTYTVRIRARLPDGTWGGFSAKRRVTTGKEG